MTRKRRDEEPAGEEAGWEGLAEESPEGSPSLAPSEELEAALQEASEAVEARSAGEPPQKRASADELMLEALSEELRTLKQAYEEKCAEAEELSDRSLRLQAEFENFRRRNLKERQEAHTYGHQNLVKDLLPSVDNLDRAIEHADSRSGADLQNLLQGVELVRRELLGVLAKHGVERIEAQGEPFDPSLHEAMAQAADPSVPANTVVQVMEPGYRLRDRMLRPARVVVSRGPEEEAASETEPSGDETKT